MNGDFESGLNDIGDPIGWFVHGIYYGGSFTDSGVEVGPQYAHRRKFDYRIYTSSSRYTRYSESHLVSEAFWDQSQSYCLCLKLADRDTAYFSGVIIVIAELNGEGRVTGFLRYVGNVSGSVQDCLTDVDRYFKLVWGCGKNTALTL